MSGQMVEDIHNYEVARLEQRARQQRRRMRFARVGFERSLERCFAAA
jgi:hypothetical protein